MKAVMHLVFLGTYSTVRPNHMLSCASQWELPEPLFHRYNYVISEQAVCMAQWKQYRFLSQYSPNSRSGKLYTDYLKGSGQVPYSLQASVSSF